MGPSADIRDAARGGRAGEQGLGSKQRGLSAEAEEGSWLAFILLSPFPGFTADLLSKQLKLLPTNPREI